MKDFGDTSGSDVERDSSSREEKSPKKVVHFADSKGLALTSTYFFATENYHCSNDRAVKSNGVCLKRQKGSTCANGKCVTKFLNFRTSPSTASLHGELEKHNVCLEQMAFCDSGVCGRIQVRNLSFEKKVFVRYTFNSWLTYEDEYASYVAGSSTGFMDAFAFRIKFSPDGSKKKMELAVCYKVRDGEFWDNNYGDNYRLIYM